MKKILLTVHKFFPEHRAGTEVLTLKVAKELQRRSYQVAVVCANPPDVSRKETERSAQSQSQLTARTGSGEQPAAKTGIEFVEFNDELDAYDYDGISVYCLNETARLKDNCFSNEHYHPYLRKHYDKLFDALAPDLVHCFHLQNLSASLLDVADNRGVPVIYSATDFWLICPIVQLRRPDGSACRGPAPLAINCLTCYTPRLFPEIPEFVEALGKKYPGALSNISQLPKPTSDFVTGGLYITYLAKKFPSAVKATVERPDVLRQFANQLSAIIVPTKLMRELFISNGLDARLIHHIPFGIDTEELRKGQNKTFSNELRIAFIGTLAEHKGPDLLIKAFLGLPEQAKASLTLYGELNQFPEYSKYLRELTISDSPLSKKIAFAGTFPNDQIGEVFSQIDVLVVPSRWYENTPLVVQSALAAKTPIVAANFAGLSELIKHEFNGLLFEPNKVQSLADALLKFIEDNSLRQRLVNNIKPEFTVAEMVDKLEDLYAKYAGSARLSKVRCQH